MNPEHLEPVTSQENVLRSLSPPSLNAKKTHCVKGHPFSPENTSTYGTRRVCKACKARYDAARYQSTKHMPATERIEMEIVI